MQISRYSADHGVAFPSAFPDLLNIKADEGQLYNTRNCASFLQNQTARY